MNDAQSLARTQEAERVLMHAISDVPLDATALEVTAAVQAIGLKLAERCMAPRSIAHVLIGQADAYLKAAGEHLEPRVAPEALEPKTVIGAGHGAISTAVATLRGCGLADDVIRELMLGFVLAWVGKSDPEAGAALLYRHADALAGRMATAH